MKNCPNCNQTVSDTAKFCRKCGFNIKKYEENDIEECFCDECGKKIPAGSDFCPECGANLSDITSNTLTSFTSLGGFDFSKLQNEAQTQLNENELSAFEFEKMSNGKYIIKKLKNKSELNIVVPKCVEIIDENAFAGSSIIDVTLPDGLIKIGACAFANCKDLETINIPYSLRIIDDEAFSGCKCLDLEQPTNVRCGKDAFKNTLPWIKKENERKRKEEEERKRREEEERRRQEEAERRRKAEEERIEAERRRQEEAERKRQEEENRRRIEEEERIRQAEEKRKRRYTPGLKFAKVKGKEACGVIGYEGDSRDVIIPEIYSNLPVIVIFDKAFYHTEVQSVEIPNSITQIGESAFNWCTSLKSITIPSSVKTIEKRAFKDCYGLTKITIKYGVEYIGDEAFGQVGKNLFDWKGELTNITIPNSVESIGKMLFWSNCSPQNVIIHTTEKVADMIRNDNLNEYRTIKVYNKE